MIHNAKFSPDKNLDFFLLPWSKFITLNFSKIKYLELMVSKAAAALAAFTWFRGLFGSEPDASADLLKLMNPEKNLKLILSSFKISFGFMLLRIYVQLLMSFQDMEWNKNILKIMIRFDCKKKNFIIFFIYLEMIANLPWRIALHPSGRPSVLMFAKPARASAGS